MRRLFSAILLLAAAAPARAHFVWILPGQPGEKGTAIRIVFSDKLEPGDPELLKKIGKTEFFVHAPDGRIQAVQLAEGKEALTAQVMGQELRTVGAVCRYGLVRRGKGEPFQLNYYATSWAGDMIEEKTIPFPPRPSVKVPLQIIPVRRPSKMDSEIVRVLWRGKPLAGAEVLVLVPGKEKPIKGRTDKEGRFSFNPPRPQRESTICYGVRVGHIEARTGEEHGKTYKEVRHYSTFTLPSATVYDVSPLKEIPEGPRDRDKPAAKPDPEATKLLADARAARATWENFPGFSADLSVNIDGKVSKGRVEVSPKGKVTLKLDDPAAQSWARHTLDSIVGHRLDNSASLETPCAFVDDNTRHPLGRAIRVLNDEFHSSYRIRGREVVVVNRNLPDASRFTITVTESRPNREKKYLPACFVVNSWDKSGVLKSSQAHRQTWKRVGKFDLPVGALVVTSTPGGKQEARRLTLSHHQLMEK